MALVTIAYQVVQEQGFVWRLVMTQHLKTGIGVAMLRVPAVRVPLWSVLCGRPARRTTSEWLGVGRPLAGRPKSRVGKRRFTWLWDSLEINGEINGVRLL